MKLSELTSRFWINHENDMLRNLHAITFPIMRLGIVFITSIVDFPSMFIIMCYMLAINNYGYIYEIVNKERKKKFIILEMIFIVPSVIIANFVNNAFSPYMVVKLGLGIFLCAGFIQYVIFHGIMHGAFPSHIDGFPVWKENLIRVWFGLYFLILINDVLYLRGKEINVACKLNPNLTQDEKLQYKLYIFKTEIGKIIY
jgi:hypothetical protein